MLVSENSGGLFKTDPVFGQIPFRLVRVPLKGQSHRIGGTVTLNLMPLKRRRFWIILGVLLQWEDGKAETMNAKAQSLA